MQRDDEHNDHSSGSDEDEKKKPGSTLKRRRKREIGLEGVGRGFLRSSCDCCTLSKIRCNGQMPCARCERRGEPCVYSEKRRCGPKRRKSPATAPDAPPAIRIAPSSKGSSKTGDSASAPVGGDRVAAPSRPSRTAAAGAVAALTAATAQEGATSSAAGPQQSPKLSWRGGSSSSGSMDVGQDDALPQQQPLQQSPQQEQQQQQRQQSGASPPPPVLLTPEERQYLGAFTSVINCFTPIASTATLREAMNPAPLDMGVAGMAPREADLSRFHACKAVLLGSVALGALYLGDSDTAARYMDESRSHVRDCFDAVIPETVACYVLLTLYYLQSLDNARVYRYMGFAQQSFGELPPQVQAANTELAASIGFYSAFLHACDNTAALEIIRAAAAATDAEESLIARSSRRGGDSPPQEFGSTAKCRVLTNISRALIYLDSINTTGQPTEPEHAIRKALNDTDFMISQALARSAVRSPTAPPPPSDLGIVAVKTLHGYFELPAGASRETMLSDVAAPVLAAVRRTPLLLNFPMGWHMSRCVRALLTRHGDATELDAAMRPAAARLSFANKCCQSGRTLYDRYYLWDWPAEVPLEQASERSSTDRSFSNSDAPTVFPTGKGSVGSNDSSGAALLLQQLQMGSTPATSNTSSSNSSTYGVSPSYTYGTLPPNTSSINGQHSAAQRVQQQQQQQPWENTLLYKQNSNGGGAGVMNAADSLLFKQNSTSSVASDGGSAVAQFFRQNSNLSPPLGLFRQNSFDLMRLVVPPMDGPGSESMLRLNSLQPIDGDGGIGIGSSSSSRSSNSGLQGLYAAAGLTVGRSSGGSTANVVLKDDDPVPVSAYPGSSSGRPVTVKADGCDAECSAALDSAMGRFL